MQKGLPCFPTVAAPACTIRGHTYYLCSSKLSHVRFHRVKVFCKQIPTCSDPYSIINKSCQACWPAHSIVLINDTAPAFGSRLACIWPAQDGKQPCSGGPAKGHTDTARAGSSAVPVPLRPSLRFPLGFSLRKKMHLITFNQSFTSLMLSR